MTITNQFRDFCIYYLVACLITPSHFLAALLLVLFVVPNTMAGVQIIASISFLLKVFLRRLAIPIHLQLADLFNHKVKVYKQDTLTMCRSKNLVCV